MLTIIIIVLNDLRGQNVFEFYTVVSDYINTKKTTLIFKFLLLTSFFWNKSLQVIKEKLS